MAKVQNKLYIGTWVEARSRHFLNRHEISHILVTAPEVGVAFEGSYKYKILPLLDLESFNIGPWQDPAADYIKSALEEGTGLLIHDFKNDSRSAICMLAYVIKHLGWNLNEGFKRVQERKPDIKVCKSFNTQLQFFEDELRRARDLQMMHGAVKMRNSIFDKPKDKEYEEDQRKSRSKFYNGEPASKLKLKPANATNVLFEKPTVKRPATVDPKLDKNETDKEEIVTVPVKRINLNATELLDGRNVYSPELMRKSKTRPPLLERARLSAPAINRTCEEMVTNAPIAALPKKKIRLKLNSYQDSQDNVAKGYPYTPGPASREDLVRADDHNRQTHYSASEKFLGKQIPSSEREAIHPNQLTITVKSKPSRTEYQTEYGPGYYTSYPKRQNEKWYTPKCPSQKILSSKDLENSQLLYRRKNRVAYCIDSNSTDYTVNYKNCPGDFEYLTSNTSGLLPNGNGIHSEKNLYKGYVAGRHSLDQRDRPGSSILQPRTSLLAKKAEIKKILHNQEVPSYVQWNKARPKYINTTNDGYEPKYGVSVGMKPNTEHLPVKSRIMTASADYNKNNDYNFVQEYNRSRINTEERDKDRKAIRIKNGGYNERPEWAGTWTASSWTNRGYAGKGSGCLLMDVRPHFHPEAQTPTHENEDEKGDDTSRSNMTDTNKMMNKNKIRKSSSGINNYNKVSQVPRSGNPFQITRPKTMSGQKKHGFENDIYRITVRK